jgi:hypothetical protein
MAQIACKLNPDWIIHLDADELWTGVQSLRKVQGSVAACEGVYLHPPMVGEFDLLLQKWYVDIDHLPIPQETKIAHRPDPNIVITHGNHAVEGANPIITKDVPRHHYPVRSYKQWSQKATKHLYLKKRNSICKRWETWYDMLQNGTLVEEYNTLVRCWRKIIQGRNDPNDFLKLLSFWCTPEMLDYFKKEGVSPNVGVWPCEAKSS